MMLFSGFTKSSRVPDPDNRRAERHVTNSLSCHLGTVVDVSTTGMRIKCQTKPPIKLGQIIEAKLDSGSQRVPVKAQVVWIKRRGFSKTYTVGFRFLNVSKSVAFLVQYAATAEKGDSCVRHNFNRRMSQ